MTTEHPFQQVHLPAGAPTPAAVVDAAVLQRNLSAMAGRAAAAGLALRPHAKTHKCVEIARRQVALGAAGLTVATVGEAEVFAGAGFTELFVAFPLWPDADRRRRVAALAERAHLVVGVAGPEAAAAWGAADTRLEAWIEIDSGHHRTGVDPADAPGVAVAAERAGLAVTGVFTFPGHAYGPGMPPTAALHERAALSAAARHLEAAGFAVAVRSGGSTPTARHLPPSPAAAGREHPLTEVRPGVYAFNDAQQVALGTCSVGDVALVVAATVVATGRAAGGGSGDGGRFVLDAGSKALGADRPPWVPGHGLLPRFAGARIESLSEHHAVVTLAPGDRSALPPVGAVVAVVPNHVCAAVNLHDELLVVEGTTVVDRWPVAARSANR